MMNHNNNNKIRTKKDFFLQLPINLMYHFVTGNYGMVPHNSLLPLSLHNVSWRSFIFVFFFSSGSGKKRLRELKITKDRIT